MRNKRLARVGDKVKIINCVAAKKHNGKIFTVKQAPIIYDRSYAAILKEIRGYYFLKNLEIVE